ncbi:hypothetical protein PVAP13_4NG273011 [Panicum virgatum]|uniref:Secreted protein n=1 Tax=Panicum virgatum TaxID=38727 RepID=A0A8T0TFH8_PANVG|nr:hypothetical protein PVAP13_4NG273011 [Panicum virgatum]
MAFFALFVVIVVPVMWPPMQGCLSRTRWPKRRHLKQRTGSVHEAAQWSGARHTKHLPLVLERKACWVGAEARPKGPVARSSTKAHLHLLCCSTH